MKRCVPNPFKSGATIRYNVPASVSNAQIIITNAVGRTVKTFTVTNKGAILEQNSAKYFFNG